MQLSIASVLELISQIGRWGCRLLRSQNFGFANQAGDMMAEEFVELPEAVVKHIAEKKKRSQSASNYARYADFCYQTFSLTCFTP